VLSCAGSAGLAGAVRLVAGAFLAAPPDLVNRS
jgi:hypothetical protein